MHPKDADRMAKSVEPDQTAPDLGLHYLPRLDCLKTLDKYLPVVFQVILWSITMILLILSQDIQ